MWNLAQSSGTCCSVEHLALQLTSSSGAAAVTHLHSLLGADMLQMSGDSALYRSPAPALDGRHQRRPAAECFRCLMKGGGAAPAVVWLTRPAHRADRRGGGCLLLITDTHANQVQLKFIRYLGSAAASQQNAPAADKPASGPMTGRERACSVGRRCRG